MIREILQKGNPILRQKSQPVNDIRAVQGIIDDLIETLTYVQNEYQFGRGCGLCAVQIGQLYRVSVIFFDKQYVLINPQIIQRYGEKEPIREGCLSFIEYRGMVPRYPGIKVQAYDRQGKQYIIDTMDKNFSHILQHELDHMDGILYIDHLKKPEDMFRVDNPSLSSERLD